jgi:lysophospholipase L1-like esterase
LLVIGFFAANDFWDAEQFERWLESGVGGNYLDWRDLGQPSAAYAASVLGRLDMAVRKHVYLANMSAYAFKRMRAVAQENSAGVTTLTVGDELPLVLNEPYILKMTQRAKPGNSGFDAALDALVRIDRIARAEGTRLVVVFQPGKETVYLPMAGRAAPMPSRSLRDALDERDIATIYLAPVFQERARTGKALYYPTDGHPNALGYRLIAEQVAEWIERNVSFPGSS